MRHRIVRSDATVGHIDFIGFRTCGDMTWLLDQPHGASQVMEYEALVTEVFQERPRPGNVPVRPVAIPRDAVAAAMAVHPVLSIGGAESVSS